MAEPTPPSEDLMDQFKKRVAPGWEPPASSAVTLRDLVTAGLWPDSKKATMQHSIKALEWAKGFSEAASVDSLLEGAAAFEAFFASSGGTNEAKEMALSAAVLIALRQPEPGRFVWDSVTADATRILAHLMAPSSAPPAPGAAASPRPGVA